MKKDSHDPAPDRKALCEGYGSTEAILLPRDPSWMFVYWEITENSKKEACRLHSADIFLKGRQVIRVHEASSNDSAGKCFDILVRHDAGNWYVNVPENGGAYYCEVGLSLPDGAFINLVRTNTVNLPTGRISDVADENRLAVTADFDELLQLSGVEYIGKGSGEVAKSLAQRWELLRAVFSRASSWGVSSMSAQTLQKPEQKKFRLIADCELILYGATESDAFVTVAGRKVPLNTDGTFSMRFAMPDGIVDLPIEALSRDKTDSRAISIKTTRATTTYDK